MVRPVANRSANLGGIFKKIREFNEKKRVVESSSGVISEAGLCGLEEAAKAALEPPYEVKKCPGETVGVALSGSGEVWRSLEEAMSVAERRGHTPGETCRLTLTLTLTLIGGHTLGETCRYIQNANGKCYFYAAGVQSGKAGAMCWRLDGLGRGRELSPEALEALGSMLCWDIEERFPALDIIRLLVLGGGGALAGLIEPGVNYFESILKHAGLLEAGEKPPPRSTVLTGLRCIANGLVTRGSNLEAVSARSIDVGGLMEFSEENREGIFTHLLPLCEVSGGCDAMRANSLSHVLFNTVAVLTQEKIGEVRPLASWGRLWISCVEALSLSLLSLPGKAAPKDLEHASDATWRLLVSVATALTLSDFPTPEPHKLDLPAFSKGYGHVPRIQRALTELAWVTRQL